MAKSKARFDYFCIGCGRTHGRTNFYSTRNPLFANGTLPFCKDFIKSYCTKPDGAYDVERLKYLLSLMDKPFLYNEWVKSTEEEQRETFGAYFSRINMNYNADKTWQDSDADALGEDEASLVYSDEWGGYYTNAEINRLDKYLNLMKEEYDLETVNRFDYAKKVVKASLATDRAYNRMLQGNDPQAARDYKEAQAIFDSLSKSAQFAQSKRKDKKQEQTLSKIIAEVEAGQYAYPHAPEAHDRDIYDELIEDFMHIQKSLE